jgi:alginate O-acetyltransferase complex protein AlgI
MNPHIFQNLEFFVLLVPTLLLTILAKRMGPVPFRAALIVFSLFFIVVLPGMKLSYGVLLVVLAGLLFVSARVLLWAQANRKRVKLIYVICGCVVVFSLIKFSSISSPLSKLLGLEKDYRLSLIPIFGFAFFALRSYSLLADIAGGKIKQLTALDFLSYVLFFPTFLAGPVERFGNFARSLEEAARSRDEFQSLKHELPRFIIGAFKVFVVAGFLQRYALPFLKEDDFAKGTTLYLGAVAYYFFEYMNFAGYSDMAISTARVLGIKLPENFNFPYVSRSLTELWQRWHMSFAAWLRDYIYYPLFFLLVRRVRPSAAGQAYLSGLSIFITFVICGLWHGDQLGTILFGVLSGLVLGAEAIATAKYKSSLTKALEKRPGLQPLYDFGAWLVTFHVSVITFAPVLLSREQLGYIMRHFSPLFDKLAGYLALISGLAQRLWDKL